MNEPDEKFPFYERLRCILGRIREPCELRHIFREFMRSLKRGSPGKKQPGTQIELEYQDVISSRRVTAGKAGKATRTAINFVILESVPELFVLRRINVNMSAVSVAELSRSLLPKSLHVLEWSCPLFLMFPIEHATRDDFKVSIKRSRWARRRERVP